MPKKMVAPKLDVVVTARPSWARVKSLVENYAKIAGSSRIRVLFVGPAVSKRYGDVTSQIPKQVEFETMQTLNESDGLGAVAQTCTSGAQMLIHNWSSKRPDCALVVADRTETLGVAMAASIMQIPLIHLQGGEISGSIDDKIRDANSKLADLHLTTNDYTAGNLVAIGENRELIVSVGCPSIDLVKGVLEGGFQNLEILTSSELGGVGGDFMIREPFGIIMFHPDTMNESENIEWIKTLIEVADSIDLNWFWFWPNPDHGSHYVSSLIRSAREKNRLNNVRFVINLPPEQFIWLTSVCKILIGNSSFGIREAAYLGLPVINIGKRQSGRQKADNVRDIPSVIGIDSLISLIRTDSENPRKSQSTLYGDGNSGLRAAEYISTWVPRVKNRKL